VSAIAYWDGTLYGTECWADKGFRLQELELIALSPDGTESERMKVVKGDD
jgi:hypothetical protein